MGRINRGRVRKSELQECAEIRREERAQRSPAQQLAELDARLGEEVGAVKERLRLAEEMSRLASERGKRKEIDKRVSERESEGKSEGKSERPRSKSKDRRKSERDRSRAGRRDDR
jgi:hypothetical protein